MERTAIFTAKMNHTSETVKKFMRIQYGVFNSSKVLIQTVLSAALIASGLFFSQKTFLSIGCLIIGCLSIANLDMIPNYSANRIISSFKNSFPVSDYSFYENGFNDCKTDQIVLYSKIIKIISDSSFYYIFVSKQYGYMIEKSSVAKNTNQTFNGFLTNKTHLKWEKPFLIYSFSIKEILKKNNGPKIGDRLGPHK